MFDAYTTIELFYFILPVIAFLYAAVGHGGASGYLAIMALFSFAPETMRPTALMLNLVVAGVSFYHYAKAGYFNKQLFFSFAIASIPAAFIGGTIDIDPSLYRKVLGVLLIFATIRMLNVFGAKDKPIVPVRWYCGALVGVLIGFFSGLIGIGGGIILSPIILLFHWGKMKEAAAVSALFIWVNSLAGLLGQFSAGHSVDSDAFVYVILALVGGYVGGYVGSFRLNDRGLRYLLALVLALASVKLIWV